MEKIKRTREYLRTKAEILSQDNNKFEEIYNEIMNQTVDEFESKIPEELNLSAQQKQHWEKTKEYYEKKSQARAMYNVIAHAIGLQHGNPILFPEKGLKIQYPDGWLFAQLQLIRNSYPQCSKYDTGFDNLYPSMML